MIEPTSLPLTVGNLAGLMWELGVTPGAPSALAREPG
jgi:hypothetical protein